MAQTGDARRECDRNPQTISRFSRVFFGDSLRLKNCETHPQNMTMEVKQSLQSIV